MSRVRHDFREDRSGAERGAGHGGGHRSPDDYAHPRCPEDALICCGLDGDPPEHRRRLVDRLLRADLDWDYLIRTVVDHAVGPLFFRSVIAERARQCPDQPVRKLETIHKLNAARNRWIFQECALLLGALEERGVEAILLKGVALAHSVYVEPAMRVMGDIDVLVRPEDIPAAEQALFDLDCRPVAHDPPPNHHLVPHVSPRKFHIEIHWDLVAHPNPFRIDRDRVWAAAQPVRLGEVRTAMLSPADQVWHAAVHDAFQHAFHRGLQCVADIAAIAERFRGELSYEELCSRAASFSVQDHVEAVLELGVQLLGRGLWRQQARQPASRRVRRLAARGANPRRSERWLGKVGARMFPALDVSPHSDFAPGDVGQMLLLADLMSTLDASANAVPGIQSTWARGQPAPEREQ